METSQKRNRIPSIVGAFMLGVSLLFDGFQGGLDIIPFAGWLLADAVGCVGLLTMFLWFTFRGVKYGGSAKKTILNFSTAIIEFVPLLNALPALTLSTAMMIAMTKTEDTAFNLNLQNTSIATKNISRVSSTSKPSGGGQLPQETANDTMYQPSQENEESKNNSSTNRQPAPLRNQNLKGVVPTAANDDSYLPKAA